jgi:hypothetical protein
VGDLVHVALVDSLGEEPVGGGADRVVGLLGDEDDAGGGDAEAPGVDLDDGDLAERIGAVEELAVELGGGDQVLDQLPRRPLLAAGVGGDAGGQAAGRSSKTSYLPAAIARY